MGIRRARMVVVAVLVAMTLLGTALAPAGASTGPSGGGGGGRFRPGAPGVGDDHFPLHGNGGYDVRHYLLRVSYDPATDRLVGVATISARATQNLSRFNLDFVGLTVCSIKVNGRPAGLVADRARAHGHAHARPGEGPALHHRGPLRRRPGHPAAGARPRLHHRGRFIHTDDGAIVAGQPEVAASWFPVNDHPIDNASSTFVVTAPADLQVVANGRLLGASATAPSAPGSGTPPSRWPPTWPRSTSASSTPAATGPTTGCGCTTPSTPTCSPSRPTRRPGLGDLRRDRPGLLRPPGRDPRLPGTAVQPRPVLHRRRQFDAFYNGIPATDPFWSVVIGDPGPELLFDNAVYLRGAMAVYALRLAVGDRDLFSILHAWTTRKAGGNGTIPQFIRLAERVSGEQLDNLFRVWLFTGAKPVLEGATAAATARATAASPSAAATLERARGGQRLRH